jgi:hypothetical protein
MLAVSRSVLIVPSDKQIDGTSKFELVTWLILK